MDDAAEVQFFCCEERETLAEVVACLIAEDAHGACTGAIVAEVAVIKHMAQEVEILLHAEDNGCVGEMLCESAVFLFFWKSGCW